MKIILFDLESRKKTIINKLDGGVIFRKKLASQNRRVENIFYNLKIELPCGISLLSS